MVKNPAYTDYRMTRYIPRPTELKVGPFSGGINTYSDPSAIADTDLVDCVNFDIDLDGSLKSRTPWRTLYGTDVQNAATIVNQCTHDILGTFVFSGYRCIVFQKYFKLNTNYTYTCGLLWIDGPSAGTIDTIISSTTVFANAVVRYKDLLWIITNTLGSGGQYDPVAKTFTASASMPAGTVGIIYKERLWIASGSSNTNPSRLYFSDVATPQTFQSTSFFDIHPGDGQTLNEILVLQDSMILFKNNSIFVFSYDTQPAQAVLQILNDSIGVDNNRSALVYENSIYFTKWSQVYEMSNYNLTRISTKIPFEDDKSFPTNFITGQDWFSPIWISLLGDRLVVRYYNRLYVFHLRTRAWTRYTSNHVGIQYMGPIFKLDAVGTTNRQAWDSYVAGNSLKINPDERGQTLNKFYDRIFITEDRYESTYLESANPVATNTPVDIPLSILTKIYDIGVGNKFKRIMHWGVDISTGRDVTGTLYPISVAYRVTWQQLHLYTWSQLQSWGYPLYTQPITTQLATLASGSTLRRFIRFPKSLRFRLLQFGVTLNTAGNTTEGPARLYSITASLLQKQLVNKAVN